MVDESTEPSEIWEHPFAEEIDRKLKPLKTEIRKLKKAQLETERHLANLIIVSAVSLVASLLPKNARNTYAQVTTNASAARTKALTSNDPLAIANAFHQTCGDTLETLGVNVIWFP